MFFVAATRQCKKIKSALHITFLCIASATFTTKSDIPMDSEKSLWRAKAEEYFKFSAPGKHNFTRQLQIEPVGGSLSPVKIAVDTTLPLSFYVTERGQCGLYSLTKQANALHFNNLGTANLPSNTSGTLRAAPNSVAHYNNGLLVANDQGVFQYDINCADVARGQNIDDFVQMALPRQEQPVAELGPPVATFYSCDIQIRSWPYGDGVHSVIEDTKLKPSDFPALEKAVREHYRSHIKPFEAKLVGFYEHKVENNAKIPLSGPISNGVRQISYTFRAPNSFQSICGCQWFDWDLTRQKQKFVGNGDGFQLLSVDASPLLRETFAIGTHGGNILLHDLRAAEKIQQMKSTSPKPISYVKFSPIIQPLLATTTDDFRIKLWDLRQGFDKPFLVLDGHTHDITGLQFSNQRADFLFSSSLDSTVRIWNINNMYPPHHCVLSVNVANSPVMDIVAGCHRTDSFYYSCANGSSGVVKLKKPLFEPVIPHKMETEEGREMERLLYFKKMQQLLAKILPKVTDRLAKKTEDVSTIFPMLDLTVSKPFDLSHAKLASEPLEDIIWTHSYFLSTAILPQFVQSPEPQQLSDAKRGLLFAQVMHGIQKRDAEILTSKKRDIVAALEAFSRDMILSIVQVMASSAFDEALEVGHSYLELLEANKKMDKFMDVGYFLLYPTIYDDPTQPFRPLSQYEAMSNARTRLKSVLKQGKRTLQEILDYQTVLATAMNDRERSATQMFETLKKHESFLSMFLCRTYLSLCLSLAQWSTGIIFATQVAKDTEGFPFKQVLFDWLEKDVMPRFFDSISNIILSEKIDPASYLNALSEVIIVASQAQTLPQVFEDKLQEFMEQIRKILDNMLGKGESMTLLGLPPAKLALAIRSSIDSHGRSMIQQGKSGRNVNLIITIINNAISTS